MSSRALAVHLTSGRTAPVQAGRSVERKPADAGNTVSFRDVLIGERLKFSHHAELRLKQRGIDLKRDQIERIANAVDQAAAKGAKDSLVLYKDMAMIVNVHSRTVVTAMDEASMKQHVFTQIDSAVVVS